MKTLKQLCSDDILLELLPKLILPGETNSVMWYENYALLFYKIQKQNKKQSCKVVLADFRLRSNCGHPVYDIYVFENGSKEPKRVTLSAKSLNWFSNLYIPETMCRIYGKKRLLAELIRQMVLVKPMKMDVDLNRRVRNKCSNWDVEVGYILSGVPVLRDEAMANYLRREYLADIMEGQREDQTKQILNECMGQFFEWGTVLHWDDMEKAFEPTEELCQRLLPALPPSVKRFTKTMEDLRERKEDRKSLCVKRTLVIQAVPYAENFPYICCVDEDGTYETIGPRKAEFLLNYINLTKIVNCMPELEGDTERIVGYLLLYLLYPLRMERYNKRQMAKYMAVLLNAHRQKLECTQETNEDETQIEGRQI